MLILAIETSADDTAAAVTLGTTIVSSVRYSQLEHAAWGGIVPSIAKREHKVRIDPVIAKALEEAQTELDQIDAIAVTVGPGLAIALEVGINKAKELAAKHHKPLIGVNHIEGHLLSPLVTNPKLSFPALGLVVSGGHTELVILKAIGDYQIIAQTMDDSLGEALDKAARMLGFPYPGGMLLEQAAAKGNPKAYLLPLPMAGREDQNQFSYSGLKAAFGRLVNELAREKPLSDKQINDLAAVFQNRAFQHLERVLKNTIENQTQTYHDLLVGGGVIANKELRHRLEKLAHQTGLKVHFAAPEFSGDNAAMIGIAAGFKAKNNLFTDPSHMDRLPRWKVDQ